MRIGKERRYRRSEKADERKKGFKYEVEKIYYSYHHRGSGLHQ